MEQQHFRCELCRANPQSRPHRHSGECNRYKKMEELRMIQNRKEQLQNELAAIRQQQQH